MLNEAKERLQRLFEKLSDDFIGTVEQDCIRSKEDDQLAYMDLTFVPETDIGGSGVVQRVRVSLITVFTGDRLTGRETLELARVQLRTGTFTEHVTAQELGEEVFVSTSPISALIGVIMDR